jgi:glycosyltransferase EpsD
MIGQFNMNNIDILLEMGYQVDVAADFKDTSVWSKEKIENFKEKLNKKDIEFFQIDFSRSPLKIGKHFKSYKETLKLLKDRKYSFIHTHTPIASALVRMAAHKVGIKVIYTAHGFHFYKGAPLKNWLIFYPIEKFFSRYTDTLITINKEDFERAKKFRANKFYYVPGVGINLEKFNVGKTDKEKKREEIGVKSNAFMLLSVGELIPRKNHEVVIKALALLKKQNKLGSIEYVICGRGILEKELKKLVSELELTEHVHFLGYRNDIYEICNSADLFVFMSRQEGLPVALMEAMACGLPVICSNIRGNTDLIEDGVTGLISKNDPVELATNINRIYKNEILRNQLLVTSLKKIKEFDLVNVEKIMRKIYRK